jgi:hypothetical protein
VAGMSRQATNFKSRGAAMQWRQTQIARATTEKEVDSALQSAERVIVKGDDHLLSYAVAKASRNPEKD